MKVYKEKQSRIQSIEFLWEYIIKLSLDFSSFQDFDEEKMQIEGVLIKVVKTEEK